MSAAFDVREISFDYEGIAAIRGLSLCVEAGQRIALVGANGSGKSTLLRHLDALYFPTSGSISFFGEPLTTKLMQDAQFASSFRRRVGFVFQNPDVQLFNPTVFDEVAFGPLQLNWPHTEVLARVNQTLEFMGITHLKERPPYRLSGGEKKRVALASILVMDPEVILLDEPTDALDPRSESQIVDRIQQWKGTAKTVITATHRLEIVEDIADQVCVMHDGRIAGMGTPAEILANTELLLRANLIHAHRHSHGGVVHSHPHSHGHAHHDHDHEH